MAILNYSTKIPVDKTLATIQMMLAKAGAQAIMTEYEEGEPSALSFRISTADGVMQFKLPAEVSGIHKALKTGKGIRSSQKTTQHAARVAWRILKDWLEVQLAIIEVGMAELPQVFLSYAQSPTGETFYESLKNKGFEQLTHEQ